MSFERLLKRNRLVFVNLSIPSQPSCVQEIKEKKPGKKKKKKSVKLKH